MRIKAGKYLRLNSDSKSTFNIFQFLLIYILLSGWFHCYVAITSPEGKIYLPLLDHYLNIITWLTWLIAKTTLLILKWIGFVAYQRAPNNVTIKGSPGVTILWACLGFGVMSFWTAFVAAHKASWQYKLKWCTTGIGIITVLNIVRVGLIAIANHYHWLAIISLEPHETFNIISYMILFILIAFFIWRYKQYERKHISKVQSAPNTPLTPSS